MREKIEEARARLRDDGPAAFGEIAGFALGRLAREAWHLHTRARVGACGAHSAIVRPRRLLNPRFVRLGRDVTIRSGARIEAIRRYAGQRYTPRIEIGDGTHAEYDLQIECAEEVRIGKNVLIAGRVFISDVNHDARRDGSHPLHAPLRAAPVRIGDGTWIGQAACILPGVELGRGCIVGANAVVTSSFPDGSAIGGVPARLLREPRG